MRNVIPFENVISSKIKKILMINNAKKLLTVSFVLNMDYDYYFCDVEFIIYLCAKILIVHQV